MYCFFLVFSLLRDNLSDYIFLGKNMEKCMVRCRLSKILYIHVRYTIAALFRAAGVDNTITAEG